MKKRDWTEIRATAPTTFEACKRYFVGKYFQAWSTKMKDVNHILEFLRTKGVGIKIRGINNSWFYKIWVNGKLIGIQKNISSEEEAISSPIKRAFLEIEKKKDVAIRNEQ